jgi:hypothetical protein
MLAMTTSQLRISRVLHHFYDDATPMEPCGQQYKKTIEKLDQELRTEMDASFRKTVLEPLARFCSYLPAVNEAIQRRKKKALDYDSQRSKVRKLIDKPSEDPQRLPLAEQEANLAREQYENLNAILVEDLPKLMELRVPYIDPCFEALVKAQLEFAKQSYEALDVIEFPPERESHVDEVLNKMRQLQIANKI